MLTSKHLRIGQYARVVKSLSSKLWVQQRDTSRVPSLNPFLEDVTSIQATTSIPSEMASHSSAATLSCSRMFLTHMASSRWNIHWLLCSVCNLQGL